MKIVGIVAEYNPFHTGHAYHLDRTRAIVGGDAALVAVMSGNWVQRGECALTDKWSRARAAVMGGVDLVLELPTVWATSSAEGFARGAVSTLAATGVLDALSFGSECGQTEPLGEIARCLNGPDFSRALKDELGRGTPFALCRRQAVAHLLGEEQAARLDFPNNNLGVEYLRFLPPEVEPITVQRTGPAHDGGQAAGFASASLLRQQIRDGHPEQAALYLPAPWSGEAASMAWCERAVLSRLRSMPEAAFSRLPGGSGGLADRLYAATRQATGLTELYDLAKTKGYAHARVRRAVLWAFLSLGQEDVPLSPLYLRVLACGGRGREVLRRMKGRAQLPVLTKPAHVQALSHRAQSLFQLEARCTDQFSLCFPTSRPCGLEWTRGPEILA